MKKITLYTRRRSEAGMVSIIVTMVMMIVISLIVLGFAQVSRREQRESLDQALSSQAFLAAESGVNDAYNAIQAMLAGPSHKVQEKTTCGPDANPASPYAVTAFNPTIDSTSNVSYTCLLITTQLKDLSQSVAADGTSVTLPLHPMTNKIDKLHFIWTQSASLTAASLNTCPAGVPLPGSFPNANTWQCPYSVLRVDLVPTDAAQLNRNSLMANQVSFFLYPTRVAASAKTYATANGAVIPMACTLTSCTVDITSMNSAFKDYGMRLSGIFASGGTVDVSAKDNGGAQLVLQDAQAQIDSTGKAQDVLRRMKARVSLGNVGSSDSNYSLQSASAICKRFGISNDQFVINSIVGQDSNNPLCTSISAP